MFELLFLCVRLASYLGYFLKYPTKWAKGVCLGKSISSTNSFHLLHQLHTLKTKPPLTLPPNRTKTPNPSPVSRQKATQAKAWCKVNRAKEASPPTTTTNRVSPRKRARVGFGRRGRGDRNLDCAVLYWLAVSQDVCYRRAISPPARKDEKCSRWKDGWDGLLAPF